MSSKPTSIRRSWRLRADNARGQALVVALLMFVMLLPLTFAFVRYVTQAVRAAARERQQKAAGSMAGDVVADYMRQFSQNAYSGHYDADSLSRPKTFYTAGYSTVTFTADEANRTLWLKAEGGVGDPAAPTTRKRVEALVQFSSDLVQYGTMVNGPFSISASNLSYLGGLWSNGNLNVSGSNVRFNGGPVVVNGNVTGAASVVIDGDLYYSGTSAGSVSVLGNRYNFIPATTWPTLDFNYYDAHYTYKTTVSRTIVLNSTQTFTVVGVGTYAIPAAGAIIYGENCNLTVRGPVSGRVTVVAGGTIGSGTQGNITVSDSVYYAVGSSVAASAAASFGALARNRITFSKTGSNLTVVGVYFVEQGTNNMTLTGSSGRRFWLYGVRTQAISVSPGTSFNSGIALAYDANLRAYPPPGLPEKALLVNWKMN